MDMILRIINVIIVREFGREWLVSWSQVNRRANMRDFESYEAVWEERWMWVARSWNRIFEEYIVPRKKRFSREIPENKVPKKMFPPLLPCCRGWFGRWRQRRKSRRDRRPDFRVAGGARSHERRSKQSNAFRLCASTLFGNIGNHAK